MRCCEACGGPLGARQRHRASGVCAECRRAGARFAVRWMRDLAQTGVSQRQIADVLGTTPGTVRTRVSEQRRGLIA